MANNFSSILSSDHLAIETLSEILDGQADQTANNLYANASIISIGNSSVYTYITPNDITTSQVTIGTASANIVIDPLSINFNYADYNTSITPFSASFSGLITAKGGIYVAGSTYLGQQLYANGVAGETAQVLVSSGGGQYWSNSVNNAINLNGVPSTSYVNSTGTYTISGVHTHIANLVFGNSTVNSTMFANSTNVFFTGVSYTANDSINLGGQPKSYYAANSLLDNYLTLAGTAANVAQLTANNSNYLGGLAANEYMLLTTLPGLQTKAALADDVHKLTANSSDYLGSYAADQYAFANVIPTLQTKADLATDVSKLAANSASYLGNLYYSLYPNKISNAIITGVYTYNANVQLRAALWANGNQGTTGQVLAADASGNVFWQTTNGQSISVNNFVVTGRIVANSFVGEKGLVLTSNGNGVYWSDVASTGAGTFDGGTPLSSYINNPRLDAGGVY
jgi:hypothetical protein